MISTSDLRKLALGCVGKRWSPSCSGGGRNYRTPRRSRSVFWSLFSWSRPPRASGSPWRRHLSPWLRSTWSRQSWVSAQRTLRGISTC